VIAGDGFRLRPAVEADVAFLAGLAARPEVADFLAAVSPWSDEALRADLVPRAGERPGERLVAEVPMSGGWVAAGGLGWTTVNERSRIASVYGVMVAPEHRGRGLAERAVRALALHLLRERGFHRVQLEVYGFNETAQRLFERAGFVREGIRRRAYARHGGWADGVLFGLVQEDLDDA
jgi:RimJ/RimL family protein N-acetyltransferase